MIIDLQRFLEAEQPCWRELEERLRRLEHTEAEAISLMELQRLHYLYERTSSDLVRLRTYAAEPEIRQYLESLVARAYAEIHETRSRSRVWHPWRWLTQTFPLTFRQHWNAFRLALLITLAGVLLGGLATVLDPQSRFVTMPFGHDQWRPSERVAREESGELQNIAGSHMTFSSYLIANNTKVALFTLALGMTYGLGTVVLLFYNGVALGAITVDYLQDGQAAFLLGWLLPHGSVEIPAILIAGQAGLVLAGALIGRGRREPLARRVRAAGPQVLTLAGGVILLLIWAGLVESFLSQYHQPYMPYALKIAFGMVQLALLMVFLARSGRKPAKEANPAT
ncbi:stage II sporulation protein M [Fontisphaera persica]|uniref:stage II sporulation protein M n=1 Tax=Fontisphaera persica TaxID=2974023 RepID=UPI0024C04FE5|nr:stage II sporulation protein M [Fontisphaera persica]WCJ60811.1 stage II sporulation protein M [Fontisphaera persica]